MLIATRDGPENNARREMNSRKRSQGGDGEQPQPTKKKCVARKTIKISFSLSSVARPRVKASSGNFLSSLTMTVSNYSTLELLLATRPPVLLMFLPLLSRRVVSWSSRSEDDSPLSIPHLVSCWGIAITIYHTVIVNGRIQYKISIASDRKTIQSHY